MTTCNIAVISGNVPDQIRHHEAIYLGAVGFPGVPDHLSWWGLLIPVRLFPGVSCPLTGGKPQDIDFHLFVIYFSSVSSHRGALPHPPCTRRDGTSPRHYHHLRVYLF